jgi:hypothetical protein
MFALSKKAQKNLPSALPAIEKSPPKITLSQIKQIFPTFAPNNPPPMSLPEIKSTVQELLITEPIKALKYLQGLLPDSSDKRNQTILLEGRLSQTNRDFNNGLIKFEDQKLVAAQVSKACLDLLNDLSESDFSAPSAAPAKPAVSAVPKFVIIYDEADQAHSTMLNRQLNVLKILKKIRVYNVYDAGGDELLARAKSEMADADYLVVLITVNLFNSPEWFGLVYEALGEGRRFIPIRIEKTDFEGTGLEKFRALPTMGRAVSEFPSQDAAYADIVGEIKKLCG